MKKCVFILLVFIIVLIPIKAMAKETNQSLFEWYDGDGRINYPITCTDKEWESLTFEDQMNRCNLPLEIAETMSNTELVDCCMRYPFAFSVTLYEDLNDAFAHFELSANQFATLSKREGYEESICSWYLSHSPRFDVLSNSSNKTRIQDSGFDSEILAQYWLIYLYREERLTEGQIIRLYDTLLARSRICRLLGYNYLGSELIDTIQNDRDRQSTIYDHLITRTSLRSNGFFGTGNIVHLPTGAYYYPGYYEKYGVTADCYQHYSGDFTDAEKTDMDDAVTTMYPSWITLGLATKKYNCHSYAYLVTSDDNIYWLNSPVPYMNSGYFTSASMVSIPTGSKVAIYSQSGLAHSVVATNTSSYTSGTVAIMSTTNCNSKIGQGGLYRTTVYDMYLLYDGVSYTAYYHN